MMDQGLQYEVVRKREIELKSSVPTAKITEESMLNEEYLTLFKTLLSEE